LKVETGGVALLVLARSAKRLLDIANTFNGRTSVFETYEKRREEKKAEEERKTTNARSAIGWDFSLGAANEEVMMSAINGWQG
jgi:hypothetical protein